MVSVFASLNYEQIGVLFLQGIITFSFILILFQLRKYFGLIAMLIFLGVLQAMQVYFASTIYIKITENFLVSPGSSVFFVASLFVILLIYIKEDANEIRKIVYALFISNLAISFLSYSFGWHLNDPNTVNPYELPAAIFTNNSWILIIGSLVLFLDAILIILLYENLAKKTKNLFLRVFVTMTFVACFDSFLFSIAAFWNRDTLWNIMTSGFITKGTFALFYSIIFTIYLKYFDKRDSHEQLFNLKDVFVPLSYREKFEIAQKDIEVVSEQIKSTESKYRTLTEIAPVGVFHANKKGELTFINERLCEIFDLSEEEILGNGWQDSVHRNDMRLVEDQWEKVRKLNLPGKLEFRILWKNGNERWALGHIVPEPESNPINFGYVGTITDITYLKNIEQEQVELREKAERSDRLKSAFLANMSHEIRTPMNGILGFSNMLKEPGITGNEQLKYLNIIEESGTRMLTLIDDLINISKIEAGILEVHQKEVNLNRLLQEIHDVFSIEAKKANVDLILNLEFPDKDAHFIIDEEKVFGVVTNLVKNALKFTSEGQITFGYLKKENFLEFFVLDTGIGIPSNRLSTIFERFVHSEPIGNKAQEGTGLGLAIAKAYVELLGGKIWVESEITKGTQFHFTIPISCKNRIEPIAKGPFGITLEKKEEPQFSKKLKILVVEDDEASQQLLLIKLRKFGDTIFCAQTREEVLKICREHPDLDLILMDIRLPGTNGYDLTKEIRTFNKDVVIIAQTAFAFDHDVKKAMDAGCNDHLTKPINLRLLSNTIISHFS